MSGLDKDRKRNQTVCFRMTPEERRELEARIKVSGLPKGKYFIQSVLHQEVKIAVGKYQSDRLSLEIRRLWERLEHLETEDLYEVLNNHTDYCSKESMLGKRYSNPGYSYAIFK